MKNFNPNQYFMPIYLFDYVRTIECAMRDVELERCRRSHTMIKKHTRMPDSDYMIIVQLPLKNNISYF